MKVSLVIDYHQNNKIFDLNDKVTNRDDCNHSFWLLKTKLKESNIELSTCDINLPLESDVSFCFDLPSTDVKLSVGSSYLFLFESEVIKPKSWDMDSHKLFKRVYTWHDELVDNKKYFKFNYPHLFPRNRKQYEYEYGLFSFSNKKLCTLISGNKNVKHSLELYSERVEIIRWFEKNKLDDFDLYGVGWDKWVPSNRYLRYILSKIPRLSNWLAPDFPSYKGKVDSKKSTLKNYKFAICYENAQMIPGYITEKIFDCFFAGCIPVYMGAPNVTDHIPSDCFIDRRAFINHKELYDYLNNMTEKEYLFMQKNITNFLFSSKADPFRAETFANTIVRHVLDDK
ncbi:MAG: glycosyltransferase family 10 [Colwellia sp.]